MNRPGNANTYNNIDLKLGIKSSLPNVKSTVGLLILLWVSNDKPAELTYSKENNGIIEIDDVQLDIVFNCLKELCSQESITKSELESIINDNQLFKSQIESLIVAFELIWKLAKISFIDNSKAYSAERTGGKRFSKKLIYSINMDIINSLISSNYDEYIKVIMSWTGCDIQYDSKYEDILLSLLVALSEGAMFKIKDEINDIIFNQNSIYESLILDDDSVDIKGDGESKGSLRILRSILSDNMHTYLTLNNNQVSISANKKEELVNYQKRANIFLSLSPIKLSDVDNGSKKNNSDKDKAGGGENTLLYGVPGSGKSWTIKNEYCNDESKMERVVFHPDYTYADFVGQILPNVSEGKVSYDFIPGPFTLLLKKAHMNPMQNYFLIIEEINRGNAPAILGDLFQLLDRKIESKESDIYPIGASEYGISNPNIAKIVYDDANHEVRIPSNMSIIGTMNTSDQNVFTLDTAFQRRWNMRMIENNFDDIDKSFADAKILDTDVTWRTFCSEINKIILEKNIGLMSSEDKRLGTYFVNLQDITYSDSDLKQNSRFPEKVLKYLWDDSFKFSRSDVFDVSKYSSLEEVIKGFVSESKNNRFKVLKESVYNTIVKLD